MRPGRRRSAAVCGWRSSFSVDGCRLPVVGGFFDHHDLTRIGALEAERFRFLFDRLQRGQAIELELQRFVLILDLLALVLQPRGGVSETDDLEVLPGEEQQEESDGDAECQDRKEFAKPLTVAFTNDVDIVEGLLLRVHSGTDRSPQTRVNVWLPAP